MQLKKFTPSRMEGGAIIGEAEIYFEVINLTMIVNIVKNKNNESIFASLPSQRFKATDGSNKYKNLAWFDKEKSEMLNKQIVDMYKQHVVGEKLQELPF